MSMGFIVAVVFAVILLSLAITWIQGTFQHIGVLTHEVSSYAKQNLLENMADQGKRVGIAAPAVTTWKKGETGDFALGIQNVFPDKETRVALIDRYRNGDEEYRRNFTESMAKLGEISSQYAAVSAAAQGAGVEVADPGEMGRFRQAVAAAMASSENGEIPTSMIVEMAEASSKIQGLGAALAERKAAQDAASAQMKALEERVDLASKQWTLEAKQSGVREIQQLADTLDKLFESELASLRVSYGIEPGLIYSYPVTCKGGRYEIVQGLAISDFSRGLMDATDKELREERAAVEELL